MSEPFIGEVRAFSFGFAPRGWAFCNGQMLSIQQNQALFSILGTTYGGDGRTSFALPNLQGQVPVGTGNAVALGQVDGASTHTLVAAEMTNHLHTFAATTADGTTDAGGNGLAGAKIYSLPGSPTVAMDASTFTPSGGSQPHSNMQPYLVLNYAIATTGIYPSRN